MRRIPIVTILAALVVIVAAPAAAQREDTFRWSGQLAAGKTLEVRGLNGNIEARPASGRTVEIVALKKGEKDDPRTVDVEVIEEADGIRVCAIYPGEDGDRVNTCGSSGHDDNGDNIDENDVVVDFTVSVPSGVVFDAGTVNGGIDVSGLQADVRVSSVNGGIEVASSGTVEASTVNGSIKASTGSASWSGTLDFQTVNGSITLTLPAGASASISAETVNGGFSSDFPLTVEAGRWGPKRVHGTIGSGGGRLNLETVNGGIAIRKS
ncbi:MAG TPA: DUF4097 family beta strand repeat-containing protein [Gemmatimonadota bacterium]|nr:DUF4097 family beta strand repeat-containing protein [Gemmatimonadota bacterium]